MKQLWAFVATYLGIATFAEADGKKSLSAEQKETLQKAFNDEFVTRLEASFAANEDVDLNIPTNATAILALQDKLRISEEARTALELDKTTRASDLKINADKILALEKTIGVLSAMAEPNPTAVKTLGTAAWDTTNEKFLGGVQQSYMAIDDKHAYNKRAYSRLMSLQMGVSIPVPEASSFDYTSLTNDLGDFYRIRKQDRIQSFIAELKSLESVFPLQSGYQDQAVLVNLFLEGDFSQAENTINSDFASLVKGGFKFEPEILTMYGVMFAHKFTSLKELETKWIGYLNKEGSSTMKWSFIEYILVEAGKKLHNEREIRRVNGERVNPTPNVPGNSLGAANGFRKFLKNQIALFKLRQFPMGEWTETNISDYVRRGTAMVPKAWLDTGLVELYMSSAARTAYRLNNERLYGLNQDYKPLDGYVKEYPNVSIVEIPNMNESLRMVWTLKGNFELFEDKPGEMLNFNIEQRNWTLEVWSNWKESLWANMVGKKYASADAIPTDYSTQLIWMNNVDMPAAYYLQMSADDVTPSVAKHSSLTSVANTVATAITDIDDAAVGQVIRIKNGSVTNGITIAAAGKFSLIAAAWTPALNDVIILQKRSDGKFIELSRVNPELIAAGFAANDATPSVSGGVEFVTNANTGATAITTLDDAVAGTLYTIYGAGTTNASTIANAGSFSLTAAMVLIGGSNIKLVKSGTDNKFYEVSRG